MKYPQGSTSKVAPSGISETLSFGLRITPILVACGVIYSNAVTSNTTSEKSALTFWLISRQLAFEHTKIFPRPVTLTLSVTLIGISEIVRNGALIELLPHQSSEIIPETRSYCSGSRSLMVCEHSDSKEPSRVIRYLRFIWTMFFPTVSTTPYIKSSAVVQVLQPVDTTLITLTGHDLGVLKHLYVGFLNGIRFDRTIMMIVWSRDSGSTEFRITNEHCRVAWCQAAPWNPMIFLVVNTKSTVRLLHDIISITWWA